MNACRCGLDQGPAALVRRPPDELRNALHEYAQALLALDQRLLHATGLGDVLTDLDDLADLTPAAHERLHQAVDEDARAVLLQLPADVRPETLTESGLQLRLRSAAGDVLGANVRSSEQSKISAADQP